jgi:integrase
MVKKAFTADTAKTATCDPGKDQKIHWDTTPGFGLRVTAAGVKSYIFQARLHGRTIRLTIGSPDIWPLETQWRTDPTTGTKIEYRRGAREEARRLKGLVDQGIDPTEQTRQQREKAEAARALAKRKATLVSEAWDAYIKQHRPHWGARHLADHRNLTQAGGQKKKRGKGTTVQGVLRPLLEMRLGDINADTLAAWQREEAVARANSARQGFELFRTFWRWCASHRDYKDSIDATAVESKDVRQEVPNRKTKRFDVLEKGQLPAWFAAVRGLNNPTCSAYLQALLLTGARREEMASLRWKDVNFQWGSIWLKDKVAEEGRKVPLTPYLAELLGSLPRSNEWVFSSPSAKNGRIAEPRIPHNRALSVAGLPHVTLHGLRRTFASLAEWVEMPTGVVAQIMGHAPNATAEKHYINRPLDLLAVWHGKYEAWILKQAKVPWAGPAKRKKNRKSKRSTSKAGRAKGPPQLRLISAA